MTPFRPGLIPLALLVLLPVACGPNVRYHPVQGRLVENGKPWKPTTEGLPPGDRGVSVTFCQLNEDGRIVEAYSADINTQDGTFTVPGPTGKGLPEGKYRLTAHLGAAGSEDKLRGALGEARSQLEYTVPGGEVVLDLGKKTLVK